MSTRLDQSFKLGLLRGKIWLHKKDATAAAIHMARGATETRALGKKVQVTLGPQLMLPNDDLHALEPAEHGGVVFGEILYHSCGSPFGRMPLRMHGPLGMCVHPSFGA